MVRIEVGLVYVLDIALLVQNVGVKNGTVVVVEIINDLVVVVTGGCDCFCFILKRIILRLEAGCNQRSAGLTLALDLADG